jgi:hypothetical protein
VEVTLPLASKDLVRLKLKETREQQEALSKQIPWLLPSFAKANGSLAQTILAVGMSIPVLVRVDLILCQSQ